AGSAALSGTSKVACSAERLPYPTTLPGAFALFDADEIPVGVGQPVMVWPDMIGDLDGTVSTEGDYPYLSVKDGHKYVRLEQAYGQSFKVGATGDFDRIASPSGFAIAMCYWNDADSVNTWNYMLRATGL